MITIYRTCGQLSTNFPPEWATTVGKDSYDKITLVTKCMRSWSDQINPIISVDDGSWGNAAHFLNGIDKACSYNDDEVVFLLEDDYLFRPDTIKQLEVACESLMFVSPYDHPAHYTEERLDKHYDVALVNGLTYRSAPSNTLTFAGKAKYFKQFRAFFHKWGISDHELWTDIQQNGGKLWNPSYSFATHMVKNCLAPNIHWQTLYQSL